MIPQHQLYLMHGMKRSGNHAIINWLLPQLDCVHFNNMVPLGPILRGRPMPGPKPFGGWRKDQERRSGLRLARLLVTLEDHDLLLSPFIDLDVPMRRLLVLRHPDHLFSSRLRKAFRVDMPAYPRANDAVMQRTVTLWKQHARCFLGEWTGYPDRIAILFDAWFSDPDYRAAISAALDVRFNDKGFHKVSGDGGGSSFDGTEFDGSSHLMNVTDRVSALEPRERDLLNEIFLDQELLALRRAVSQADPYRHLLLAGD